MKWISCSDRLPALHTKVLAVLNGDHIVLSMDREYPTHEETFTAFNYWLEPYDEMMCIEHCEVTYWAELPELPSLDKEENNDN